MGGWSYDGGANAYSEVLPEVNLLDPPNSSLLLMVSTSPPEMGGPYYPTTSEGYQIMLSWIEDGAPNN